MKKMTFGLFNEAIDSVMDFGVDEDTAIEVVNSICDLLEVETTAVEDDPSLMTAIMKAIM